MINKVVLVGRLTADPELKQTQSGISVTSFSVACNRQYQTGGERVADFINCVAWRQTAEFISKYFRKGHAIGLDGSIQTRKYVDKSGNNRIAFEVVVDNATFVESKSSAAASTNTEYSDRDAPKSNNSMPANQTPAPGASYESGSFDDFQDLDTDDDLPF